LINFISGKIIKKKRKKKGKKKEKGADRKKRKTVPRNKEKGTQLFVKEPAHSYRQKMECLFLT